MTDLINRFDKLMNKYEELHSEFVVPKNVDKLLKNRVVQRSHYIGREIIKTDLIPTSIPNNIFEKKLCDALSLTGILVKQLPFSNYPFFNLKRLAKSSYLATYLITAFHVVYVKRLLTMVRNHLISVININLGSIKNVII